MNLRLPYHLLLFVLLNTVFSVSAQVTIPDVNFRQFLATNYPAVLNPDQTLNPAAAQLVTGPFFCVNKNISNLSGIEYFTNITTLEVKKNPDLQTIPDISALTGLTILGLDSNGLTSLPNVSTLTDLEIFSVRYNKLSSLPSLDGLTKVKVLFIDYNKLTSVPSLNSLVNLEEFICCENRFTSLPSFSNLTKLRLFKCQRTPLASIPDLNSCVDLEYLICTDNQVSTLPSMNNCTLLKELKLFHSNISSLPDLSIYPALYDLKLYHNKLSFEDLIPLSGMSFFAAGSISPQYATDTQQVSGFLSAPFALNLPVDDNVSGNSYKWFKDGNYYSTTTVNRLVFTSLQNSDAGVYTCEITNSTLPMSGIVVYIAPITVTVAPCIVANQLFLQTSQECEYPIEVTLDENSFTGGQKPFIYVLKFKEDSLLFNTHVFSLEKEAVYDLIVKDAQGCRVVFKEKFPVKRSEKCDPVFYPNGDGVADFYFVEETGPARIYNRAGEVVKQLSAPAHWDGTDNTGKSLPTGLYVIEINKKSIRVSLLR